MHAAARFLAMATTTVVLRRSCNARILGLARRSYSAAHKFDADTALAPDTNDPVLRRLRAPLSADWSVAGSPNGGLLMAIAISAMRAHRDQPFRDPITLTAHFLAPAVEGAWLEARATVLKVGHRSATASATLSQAAAATTEPTTAPGSVRPRVHAIATFGDLATQRGATLPDHADPPQLSLPPPAQCVRGNPRLRPDVSVADRAELRVAPDSAWARGFAHNGPGAGLAPAFVGWLRLADGGRAPCLRGLALLADVTPPPLLNALGAQWLPTVEMTTHFRARPFKDPEGWVAVRARAWAVRDGVFATDGEIWDNAGEAEGGPRLCAVTRQLAKVVVGE